ncbi:MAG: HAMP domain-containing protein [Chloroflexi bacterium]|nr:HAMP domain-containing protein [Chloroflexota bacterium]
MTSTAVPRHRLPRWQLHARARLALWYIGLLAATLLGLGLLAMVLVDRTLTAALDASLNARTRTVEQAVLHELEEEGRENERRGSHLIDELASQAIGLDVLRIWDARGRLLGGWEDGARIDASAARSLSAPTVTGSGDERLTSGMRVRLMTRQLTYRGRASGTVQVGRSTAENERVLGQLQLYGVAGTLLALALAGIGGIFLAGRALAPIARMTREAEAIGADDLSRRLALNLPDDEIGRLARAFDSMIARLEVAFERQRQFTADASHELRSPLGIIRTQLDVALSRPRTPDEYADVLRGVRTEHERLAHLLDRLLTLARADGPGAVTLVPTDVQELVADLGVSVAPQARVQGVRLEVTLDDVPEVNGDPIWLTQLLLNLLENALRYTPAGGSIRLRLGCAGDGVAIEVADSGVGISPEHLPRLFERFYRAASSRERASGGAGLGLAICAWVARVHGGRLTAESTVGKGTTMRLWLPAAAAPRGAHQNAELPPPTRVGHSPQASVATRLTVAGPPPDRRT